MIEGMKTIDRLQFHAIKSDTNLPSARIGAIAGILFSAKIYLRWINKYFELYLGYLVWQSF